MLSDGNLRPGLPGLPATAVREAVLAAPSH